MKYRDIQGRFLRARRSWVWRDIKNVRRGAIGFAISFGIFLGILIDTRIPPVEYIIPEAQAEEPRKKVLIEVEIDWTRERIDKEIEERAAHYGTSAATLKRIVQCESGYVTDIQSRHMLSYGREKSFGLAQIHLPSHPNVTYEEAIDPKFAINYLAKHYAAGTDKWSCK